MQYEDINLTKEDILEKAFKIDTRGYRPKEVDSFLDSIIKDYITFEKIIKSLCDDKEELLEEIKELKERIKNLKDKLELIKDNEKEITNVDLLKRISKLEKEVYELKEEED